MKFPATILLSSALLLGNFSSAKAETHRLFNGSNLDGWHADVPAMDNDPSVRIPFIVREGLLVSLAKPGGHLITDAIHADYRLTVEYRFAAQPGNCGVLVHVSTPRSLYGMFPQAIEAQLMHTNAGDFWCIAQDITTPDMEARRGPKERWGVDGDKLRRIPNLTDGSEKAAGEWNTMVIECLGDRIKVWVNGDLVNYGYNCEASRGRIALQAEGSEVEFRKVELAPITVLSDPAPPAAAVTDPVLQAELLAILEADQQDRLKLDPFTRQHGLNSPEVQALWKTIHEKDAANLTSISAILDARGWVGPEVVGPEAGSAFFYVIQHADTAAQKKYLPLLRAAVLSEKAPAGQLALMEDRVALAEGRPQTYGSQLRQDNADGKLFVCPLADPDHVDERRVLLGLPPMAEYLSHWNLAWDVAAYKEQLPELEKRQWGEARF